MGPASYLHQLLVVILVNFTAPCWSPEIDKKAAQSWEGSGSIPARTLQLPLPARLLPGLLASGSQLDGCLLASPLYIRSLTAGSLAAAWALGAELSAGSLGSCCSCLAPSGTEESRWTAVFLARM